jgi:hypothetical protein
MKRLLKTIVVNLLLIIIAPATNAQDEDPFSLGYVNKLLYDELDWEFFRSAEPPLLKKGVIDGFLLIKRNQGEVYEIQIYETLEALDYSRPRRSFSIETSIFKEGLTLEVSAKNLTILNRKWVRLYGIIEIITKNSNWPLGGIERMDSIEWRDEKGNLVRSL